MERLEAHQEQSINKYSEEEYTGSSKFEEIQEICVKEKRRRYRSGTSTNY